MKKENLSSLVPNAVALALGVSSIVLLILNNSSNTVIPLLAISVVCLAFVGLNKE